MFDSKKTELFKTPEKAFIKKANTARIAKSSEKNAFVESALEKGAETVSGNMAKKYAKHSSEFVTQFNNLGVYRKPRSYKEIASDMATLWSINKQTCVQFALYIRLISRTVQLWNGDKTENVQKGAGLKHEGIVRMMWLAVNHPETFWHNLDLFIACGSWKDIFEMMNLDLQYHGWEGRVLDWEEMGNTVLVGLENPNTSELVKKYLPRIQAKSACKTLRSQAGTLVGKFLASVISGKEKDYVSYRKLKSSGTAHTWQQFISKRMFDRIDFSTVHGRALSALASSKFLKNNGLEATYSAWIAAKPAAKFTGYVTELAQMIVQGKTKQGYQVDTVNKQYNTLLALALDGVDTKSGLIVARDTSGSMSSKAYGVDMTSDNIAGALSVMFGDMLEGQFKGHWIEFASTAVMRKITGSTFSEKFQSARGGAGGYTNFMGIAQLFSDLRRRGVPEKDFPTGVLCVSDGEFDRPANGKTNVQAFRKHLRQSGFSEGYIKNFQFIFWDIPNTFYGPESSARSKPKFETFKDEKNVFYMSGYAAETLGFLFGGKGIDDIPTTAEELFAVAMDQEVLNMVVL